MNYWVRFPGDWLKDTMLLTLAQDGAYMRLLDVYYASEKPLPREPELLYRLARAQTAEERAAVDHVIERYWIPAEGGLVNERAERELNTARIKIANAQENGKKGGRPRLHAGSGTSQKEPSPFAIGSSTETQTESSPSPSSSVKETKPTNNQGGYPRVYDHEQEESPYDPTRLPANSTTTCCDCPARATRRVKGTSFCEDHFAYHRRRAVELGH